MRCPYCGSLDTQVKDSRPSEDHSAIRRRRVCPDCGGRFTTFERIQLREITVLKRSGKRAPFDRDKLARSIEVALRKRPVDPERVERLINGVVRQLESQGEGEISSEDIGNLVMEALKSLDEIASRVIGEIVMETLARIDTVAYVRFASVYKNFREAKEFGELLDELSADQREAGEGNA
ncbi:MAG TPA: transcriptional regulator NrdR [Rhabdaerophilum sp.]|nr:transcriptional regulator NrdR [Rhabdaerophilum sp.]